MGLMKAIYTDVEDLVNNLMEWDLGGVDAVGDAMHSAGWRSPTEVDVALRVLTEGDLPRAAAILRGGRDVNPVSTQEACS